MLGDNPDEWCAALFNRATGAERRRLLLLDGRPPGAVSLPLDADRFEEFRLDKWTDGIPVYESSGFTPRG